MLQKPGKASYNKLNRRQVLEILGIGMGALAIGGCTSKLVEHDLSSSNQLEPLTTSASSLFWRTTQARRNLDKEYLRERSRRLKKIVKQLKKGQGNPAELVNEARQACYEIVGHWAEKGVLQALDEDLKEILVITPESLILPLPETKTRVKQLQLELGISDDDIQGWERKCSWDKGRLLKAIKQEGTAALWQHWLVKTLSQVQFHSESSPFVPLPFPPAVIAVGALLLILLVVAYSCECGLNETCPDEPPPPPLPPPPPPPPSGGCFVKGTLVAAARGLTPIEEIQINNEVYTFDLVSGATVARKVAKTFTAWEEEIFVLDFGAEEIRCTPLHRFYTGQWIHAKDLSCGDRVLGFDGQWKELRAIRQEVKPQLVFNLYVDDIHNYFVGQVGLLVHNQKQSIGTFTGE